MGFFGGFAIDAPVFGVHVDVNKIYTPHWLMVTALFASAAALALARPGKRRSAEDDEGQAGRE